MRQFLLTLILIALLFVYLNSSSNSECPLKFAISKGICGQTVSAGMTKEMLFKIYPKTQERTYRVDGKQEWISFNNIFSGLPNSFITFHFKDNKLITWKANDRKELVKEYLSEFSPLVFETDFPNIYRALSSVLNRIPINVFVVITDRSYPVIFTEYYTKGLGRIANSEDVFLMDDDPPAFMRGFYLIKLSAELNDAKDPAAIEAVIAHEIVHMLLKHCLKEPSAENEKEANRLIKKWGFEKEFFKAKECFKK